MNPGDYKVNKQTHLERLRGAELCAARHEPRHLCLCQVNLQAAEVRLCDVLHLVLRVREGRTGVREVSMHLKPAWPHAGHWSLWLLHA